MLQSDDVLSIFASYDGLFEDVGFTIAVYSSISLSWNNALPKAMFTAHVSGFYFFLQLLDGVTI
jgi:calpain-7